MRAFLPCLPAGRLGLFTLHRSSHGLDDARLLAKRFPQKHPLLDDRHRCILRLGSAHALCRAVRVTRVAATGHRRSPAVQTHGKMADGAGLLATGLRPGGLILHERLLMKRSFRGASRVPFFVGGRKRVDGAILTRPVMLQKTLDAGGEGNRVHRHGGTRVHLPLMRRLVALHVDRQEEQASLLPHRWRAGTRTLFKQKANNAAFTTMI